MLSRPGNMVSRGKRSLAGIALLALILPSLASAGPRQGELPADLGPPPSLRLSAGSGPDAKPKGGPSLKSKPKLSLSAGKPSKDENGNVDKEDLDDFFKRIKKTGR